MLGDTPIVHDFTDDELRLARAGYGAYVRTRYSAGRRGPWEVLEGHDRFRWCLVARIYSALPHTTEPAHLRSIYFAGYRTREVPWEDLKPLFQRCWFAVAQAMEAARGEQPRQPLAAHAASWGRP